ncbi:hypothetical protein WK60_00130 [Burkholderia ubonensis]|nr:hypothetical protein WK60_00130 [Burkholderia ubonensis]
MSENRPSIHAASAVHSMAPKVDKSGLSLIMLTQLVSVSAVPSRTTHASPPSVTVALSVAIRTFVILSNWQFVQSLARGFPRFQK